MEQTPVELLRPERTLESGQILGDKGALALVRSGALYLDPATGDVWFHPWGGKPRVPQLENRARLSPTGNYLLAVENVTPDYARLPTS